MRAPGELRHPVGRLLLVVGVLGGSTTFSSSALEALTLAQLFGGGPLAAGEVGVGK